MSPKTADALLKNTTDKFKVKYGYTTTVGTGPGAYDYYFEFTVDNGYNPLLLICVTSDTSSRVISNIFLRNIQNGILEGGHTQTGTSSSTSGCYIQDISLESGNLYKAEVNKTFNYAFYAIFEEKK